MDAREGGFSVLGLPIGARLTVFGTVVQEPGEDLEIATLLVRELLGGVRGHGQLLGPMR